MGKIHDVIVVGAGAAGAWAVRELTAQGVDVLWLDAGALIPFNPAASASASFTARGSVQQNCYLFDEGTSDYFVDDTKNPYTTVDGKPFNWIRAQAVGGRMHLWARVTVRWSESAFLGEDRDGEGRWPIRYQDLAPHYERVEQAMRVSGTPEGMPQLPDGHFTRRSRLSASDEVIARALNQRWPEARMIPARTTDRDVGELVSESLASGHCTLMTDASVARLVVDSSSGRVRGVQGHHRRTGEAFEREGRAVLLCASTIETVRLLLNSRAHGGAIGLEDSSGMLGRYLMDHCGANIVGIVPGVPPEVDDRLPIDSALIPRFRNLEGQSPSPYRGGFQLQATVVRALRHVSSFDALSRMATELGGTLYVISAFGETLGQAENRVTLDDSVKDAWGVPAARIDFAYGENERLMLSDMTGFLGGLARAARMRVTRPPTLLVPGTSVHEVGGARMGDSPDRSVLDPQQRVWGLKNLFVGDGACFVSSSCHNPTLTIMALAGRAAQNIIAFGKRNEL